MELIITNNEKEYGFKFNNLTFSKYCNAMDIDFDGLQDSLKKNILESNIVMFQCAHEVFTRGVTTMDQYEVADFLEAISQDEYDRLMEAFRQSYAGVIIRLTSFAVKHMPQEEEKKK